MTILQPNDPRLGPDIPFFSPFPSEDSNARELFGTLIKAVEALPGASPGGMMAAMQADAWSQANRVLMRERFTAKDAGGIRTDWLPDVADIVTKDGFQTVVGMFASVSFPNKADSGALRDAAIEAGLNLAQNVLSAVPVVGNILSAAVGFGKMIWRLLSGSKQAQIIRVPWQEYKKAVDQDFVNFIIKGVMASTDWTLLFRPALDWASGRGFQIRETEKKGETRAWGIFSEPGNPMFSEGLGFMPGTERITQVIQIANSYKGPSNRIDVVTDVGSFLPSSAQWSTGGWEMVLRGGNPDMYKVRAGELADEWENYFDTMFSDAWEQWSKVSDFSRLFIAKALGEFIYKAGSNKNQDDPDAYAPIDASTFAKPYITPDIFNPNKFVDYYDPGSRYKPLHELWVLPALRTLKQRQKSMLARSVVCALVRFDDVAGMPAFAAFQDKSAALDPAYSTFGEELIDYCKEMRALLLNHPARHELAHPIPGSLTFQVNAPDVRDVDPVYADKLEPTLIGGLPLKAREPFGLVANPLEPDAPKPDGAASPGGGPPFPPGEEDGAAKKWLLPLLALGSVAGGIGGALFLQRR